MHVPLAPGASLLHPSAHLRHIVWIESGIALMIGGGAWRRLRAVHRGKWLREVDEDDD